MPHGQINDVIIWMTCNIFQMKWWKDLNELCASRYVLPKNTVFLRPNDVKKPRQIATCNGESVSKSVGLYMGGGRLIFVGDGLYLEVYGI